MNTVSMSTPAGGTKWPLTGGVPSQLSTAKDRKTERLYLAGYADGSVRIWDATFPVFSFICLLVGQVSKFSQHRYTSFSVAISNYHSPVRFKELK